MFGCSNMRTLWPWSFEDVPGMPVEVPVWPTGIVCPSVRTIAPTTVRTSRNVPGFALSCADLPLPTPSMSTSLS